MPSVELIKLWLKIDWPDEDLLLTFLLSSAQGFLETSGCESPVEGTAEYPVYERAILMLVSHWYNNRTGVDDMNDILAKPLTYGIQDCILKLKKYKNET